MSTVCFTGRRPKDLIPEKSKQYDIQAYSQLVSFLTDELDKFYDRGARTFITGGAQGFDQLAFWAVDNLKDKHPDVQNVVYVPFEGQDAIWLDNGLFGKNQFRSMLRISDEHRIITEGTLVNEINENNRPVSYIQKDDGTTVSVGKALYMRNHAMVDEADAMIALFPTDDIDADCFKHSGTAGTIKYAKSVGKSIYRLDYDVVDNKVVPKTLSKMRFEGTSKENDLRVFVSGSMSIKTIPDSIKTQINDCIDKKASFYIGDAPGVDTMIQQYLMEQNYDDVTIYHSGPKIRNKVNSLWTDKAIEVPNNTTGRAFYTVKDEAMTNDCNAGIVLWDGQSKGTKANIERLKSKGISPFIYNSNTLNRDRVTIEFSDENDNFQKD